MSKDKELNKVERQLDELGEYLRDLNKHFNSTYVYKEINFKEMFVTLEELDTEEIRHCTYIEGIGWVYCNASGETLLAL